MANAQLNPVLWHLRELVNAEGMKTLSDGDLLRQFVTFRKEAAFAALLDRYGPMVQSVCRRVLGHEQDAEDAFQATFLVLARRGASIRKTQAVGAWIYRVAYRIATKAGRDMTRRRLCEEHAPARAQAEPPTEAALRELQTILQEEVNRLPEKYRAPFLLCCLQGKSGADAARQLGWKEGTMSGRLTEARKLLERRLTKRGLQFPAALCVAYLAQPAVTAAVRANLARATVKAALSFAAGRAPASGLVSGQALLLADGVLRVVTAAKVLTSTALVLVGTLLGLGAGLAAKQRLTSPLVTPQKAPTEIQKDHGADNAAKVPVSKPAKKPHARLDRFGDQLPEGALARFGTVRLRQGWMVQRVLFSPDGKKLALAGIGRPLGLWDVATGKELRQFHQKDVQADGVAFSPDGTMLAEGDLSVRLWDTKTGALRRELPAAQASQRTVVFTPNGKVVISGGHDNLIHLWNAHSGQSLGKFEGHTNSVLTLAVSKDGSTLASAGSDKTIRLWNLAGRKQIREIKGLAKKDNYFNVVSFSPDGRWLASAEGEGNAPARVWDVVTGKEHFQVGDNSSHARTVDFSPDGRLIAAGYVDGAIRLWNPRTGKKVREWSCGFGVRSLAFSPNGKMLAMSSIWDSGPRLWDAATGTEIRPSDTHRSTIQQICLSPDGKSLLSQARDQQLIQWDLATKTPKRLMELPFGTRWEHNQELSPDGRVLAQTSSPKRTVTLIDPQTRKPLRALLHIPAEPYFLRFSGDGRTLAIGCQKGGFYLWNWQGEARARRIETPEKDMVIIHLFTPDGKQLVTGSMKQNNLLLHLWDVATGKRVLSFPGNNGFPTFAIAPDGKWAVAAGYGERSIHVIDVLKRKKVRTISVPQRVSGLAFSPDGQVLAYGDTDGGRIGLLDFTTGELVASFQGQHSGVGQLLFSSDGRSLFSGAGDSTILHWDATGRLGKRPRFVNLSAAWHALAGDSKVAYSARWDFLDSPKKAIALFREHIRAVPVGKSHAFEKLVEALNSESYAERKKAASAIRAMGLSAEHLLRKQLESKDSLEVRRRLQALHVELMRSSSWRRTQAVLAIVSAVPPDNAWPLLEELAAGHPDAMLTLKAKQLLARMNKSRNAKKK